LVAATQRQDCDAGGLNTLRVIRQHVDVLLELCGSGRGEDRCSMVGEDAHVDLLQRHIRVGTARMRVLALPFAYARQLGAHDNGYDQRKHADEG
jgi:hypothetical protein